MVKNLINRAIHRKDPVVKLILDRKRLSEEKRRIASRLSSIDAALTELLDLDRATKAAYLGWLVRLVRYDRKTIKRDKLISRGVPEYIIDASTDRSPVQYVRVDTYKPTARELARDAVAAIRQRKQAS